MGPSPSPQPHELGVRRTSCFFHAYGIEHAALNLFRMVSSWLWGNHGVQFRDRRPSRVYSHKAMITALEIVSLSLCERRRPASIQSPKPLFKSTAPVMPDVCPPGPPADPAPALGCARCGRRGLTNQEGLAGLAESKLFFFVAVHVGLHWQCYCLRLCGHFCRPTDSRLQCMLWVQPIMGCYSCYEGLGHTMARRL